MAMSLNQWWVPPKCIHSVFHMLRSELGSEVIIWLESGSQQSEEEGKAKLGFRKSAAGLYHKCSGARAHGGKRL